MTTGTSETRQGRRLRERAESRIAVSSPWSEPPRQQNWEDEIQGKLNGDLDRLEATANDDRLFFEDHPGRRFHLRLATPHERYLDAGQALTLVVNVGPGLRVRIGVAAIFNDGFVPDDDEGACKKLFEQLAPSLSPQTRSLTETVNADPGRERKVEGKKLRGILARVQPRDRTPAA
ncbi:MAG: hypothetical protein WBX25_05155 [Rhodomicrobium sp.]